MQKIMDKCYECPCNEDCGHNTGDLIWPCGQQNCWDDLVTYEDEEEEYDNRES